MITFINDAILTKPYEMVCGLFAQYFCGTGYLTVWHTFMKCTEYSLRYDKLNAVTHYVNCNYE